MPLNAIIEAVLIEGMKKELFFDDDIISYIQELKKRQKIDNLQELELKDFFLIFSYDGKEAILFQNEDFEFFTRKLFSLFDIPNTEKINLIYHGISFKKFDEESAKDMLKDFNLIELHNFLILKFENSIK